MVETQAETKKPLLFLPARLSERPLAARNNNLYLLHISLHGLIRGNNPEIGRDSDTGGQVRYVLDLVRALERDSRIRRVDLLTRRITDPKISTVYQQKSEALSEKATLFRLSCGPRRYLRKEVLWPHLQEYIDQTLRFIRQQDDIPDIIHAHYADAGLVAARVSKVLGIPFVFTGHSLGRYKLKRLLENGQSPQRAEKLYNFANRIEAEEETLENASLIITSTRDEIERQYKPYDHYNQQLMQVIPPGCDIKNFAIASNGDAVKSVRSSIERFLHFKDRPGLLVLARPDRQKNILAAIHMFGRSSLKDHANLILFIGNRNDIRAMETEQRQLLTELLLLIDYYDLHGHVAYPKTHETQAIPAVYRYIAETKGLLLQLSQYENFGLTLVEAAAAGVPVISSANGGPADILETCQHGIAVDPADYPGMAESIKQLLDDPARWQHYAENGKSIAARKYCWEHHVGTYISSLERIIMAHSLITAVPHRPKRFVAARHVLVCDIDDTLTGDRQSITRLNEIIGSREDILFGIATGRNLESAIETLREWNITEPNFYITSVGTAIHYHFGKPKEDTHWKRHIQFRWKSEQIRRLIDSLPGLELQEADALTPHKISYYYDSAIAPTPREIKRILRKHLLRARVVISRGKCLDILPVRASKGHALRYLTWKWQFDVSQIITAGDAGNDIDMLRGHTKGIAVGNHSSELDELRQEAGIYFSPHACAAGVLDGLSHYGVLLPLGKGDTASKIAC